MTQEVDISAPIPVMYAVMMLDKAGTPISTDSITKVLDTVDIHPDTDELERIVNVVLEMDIDLEKKANHHIKDEMAKQVVDVIFGEVEEEPKPEKKEEIVNPFGNLFG